MNIITNEARIRRNARIGQIASIAGLLVLGGGLYISFQLPELFTLSWGALLLGFLLSQIGLYFGNRFGRRPRPDEQLNLALKGLNRAYTLYHYQTPASHLLVGPAGIWVLLPRSQGGTITYRKGRWRLSGGGIWALFRRFFAQEGLGRPDLEIQGEVNALARLLTDLRESDEDLSIQAALVFTNQQADLLVDEAPIPSLPSRKLKELIRKQAKEKRLSTEKANQIQQLLEGEVE